MYYMRIICDNTNQEMEDRDRSLVAVSTVGGELPVRHYYRHEYDEVDGCILSRRQDSQVKYITPLVKIRVISQLIVKLSNDGQLIRGIQVRVTQLLK